MWCAFKFKEIQYLQDHLLIILSPLEMIFLRKQENDKKN